MKRHEKNNTKDYFIDVSKKVVLQFDLQKSRA